MKTKASMKQLRRVGGLMFVSVSVAISVFLAAPSVNGADRLTVKNNAAETKFVVTEDGKVGIGTATPEQDFDVVAPNMGLLRLSNTDADNTIKGSRMVLRHYSNSQLPVYLFGAASTASANFVAFGGGNPIGNAATQLDLFTAETPTTPVGTPRITIKGNGYIGIGTQTPSYPLQMWGGAYSDGGSWIDGSSREYKEDIEALSTQEAMEAIKELSPVKYAYRTDRTEKRVGFIAEDVPGLVATKDRKGVSSMDIVAVLTKVVQEQQKTMQEQREAISNLTRELMELKMSLGR